MQSRRETIKDRFVRLPEVISVTSIPESSIYRMVKSGTFPAPVKISLKSVAWSEQAIVQWMESRKTPEKQYLSSGVA